MPAALLRTSLKAVQVPQYLTREKPKEFFGGYQISLNRNSSNYWTILNMNIPLEDICTLISLVLGLKQVEGNDRIMEDLAAQSLDFINILTAVERKYDVFLDDSLFPQINTVNDLHREVQAALQQSQ